MLRAPFILLLNLLSFSRALLRAPLRALMARQNKKRRRFVKLAIPPGLALRGAPRRFGPLTLGRQESGPWWDFREALDRIAEDPTVEGVYVRLRGVEGGLAELQGIARSLHRLQLTGKRVVMHLDQAMLRDYALASAASTLLMTPPGRLYTFGMRMELMFLGELLERLGVTAQFVHLGPFKTAMHRLTRRRMTQAQLRGSRQLLEGLAGATLDGITERRQLPPGRAAQLLELAPVSARDALRLQLIDRAVYAGDVKDSLKAERANGPPVALISAARYLKAARDVPRWRPLLRPEGRLGVLSLTGTIMMGDEGGLLSMRAGITPRPILRALESLERDPSVKAVLLHIDSPGGSALASDLLWRRIRELDKAKPVIAFLGNVAASGGYYMAVGARRIVAMPETITGSIGVIAGKVSGGLLLERLGVHTTALSVGGTAGFGSLSTALSPQEISNLQRDIRDFYRRFLHRVALGRGIPKRTLHRIARGRVYTGRRALSIGLVDELGDLEDALALACRAGGLDPSDAPITLIDPSPTGLRGLLQRSRTQGQVTFHDEDADAPLASSPLASTLQPLVPERLQSVLAVALLLQRPGALALWPCGVEPR